MKKRLVSILMTGTMLFGGAGLLPAEYGKTLVASAADVGSMYPVDSTYVFLKGVEGFSSQCFWDVSQWTIGYGNKCPYNHSLDGSTNGQKGGHSISESEARQLFNDKLTGYVNTLKSNCKGLSMNQNQFDALLSATYNHGNVNNCPLKYYLQGTLSADEAREQYLEWYINKGTNTEQGLRNRRKKEADLFFRSEPINSIVDNNYPNNLSCTAPSKINTYDEYGNKESNRWVDAGDSCTLIEVYTSGYWKIDYPAGNTRRIAYIKLSEWNPYPFPPFNPWEVDTRYNTNVSCTAPAQIHTYDSNGNQESNRWVDAGDSCVAIEAYTNGYWKIDYPASGSRRIAYMKLSEWNPFIVHTHSYTSEVTKEPTCTVSGVRTYSCSCGDTYTETIPSLGHKYIISTFAPTETHQGYNLYTCSYCGDYYIDIPPVPIIDIPKVSYVPGDSCVKLTWTAVNNAERYAICGYVNNKWQKLADGNGTSYTLKNLKAGTEYKVAVVAMVGGKWKQDFSNAIMVTSKEAESRYPKVTSEISGNQFRLKWTPVANAEKYGIAVYQNNKWKVQVQVNGNVTTFTSPKIKKGTYKMVICAKVNGKWDTSSINSRAFKVEIQAGTSNTEQNNANYTKHKYGTSELGRDLEYYSFEPKDYSRTVLLNFAIHGFEDEYSADAQVLVDTANQLIEYYNKNFDKLKNTRLIIVPCANPDGLLDGTTNNGFGRCNAKGIDLNRDFDANYRTYSSARNYTQSPFSASESRALRDLVLSTKPEITIDFHGWENCTIGNYNIAQVFLEEMGLAHNVDFGTTNASGYFSNWAYQQGSAGLLVEFTNSSSVSLAKLENAINRLLAGEYNKLEKDERFANFERLNSFTLSTERVTTYKFINEPFSSASYIDGMVDNCIILEVYKNGWVKVQYPITNGNKVAYARLWNFTGIDTMKSTFEKLSVTSNITVNKRSDLSETYGSVYATDEAYIINEEDNAYQIIYQLDAGGWKMGWISK